MLYRKIYTGPVWSREQRQTADARFSNYPIKDRFDVSLPGRNSFPYKLHNITGHTHTREPLFLIRHYHTSIRVLDTPAVGSDTQ